MGKHTIQTYLKQVKMQYYKKDGFDGNTRKNYSHLICINSYFLSGTEQISVSLGKNSSHLQWSQSTSHWKCSPY